mmetsp:Transcript_17479/g.23027  ORF Transcript_17479/g.23027 Transcript_17479/m.23027 type:complete len:80 (-) Transcript_17479:61-300(-)
MSLSNSAWKSSCLVMVGMLVRNKLKLHGQYDLMMSLFEVVVSFPEQQCVTDFCEPLKLLVNLSSCFIKIQYKADDFCWK